MNVEIGTEAAQFPFGEYFSPVFSTVRKKKRKKEYLFLNHSAYLWFTVFFDEIVYIRLHWIIIHWCKFYNKTGFRGTAGIGLKILNSTQEPHAAYPHSYRRQFYIR
jgi:hypothetical protein